MSEHIEEQPYDDRHNTPPQNPFKDNGDHIGNDNQEPMPAYRAPSSVATEYFRPIPHDVEDPGPLPYRAPAPVSIDLFRTTETAPSKGLQWVLGDGSTLVDIASWDWSNARQLSNIELRTIHAHLLETIAGVRAEMRERSMVVDF